MLVLRVKASRVYYSVRLIEGRRCAGSASPGFQRKTQKAKPYREGGSISLVSEFKEFINRGNVMDMAVGVVVGGAFTAIVTSLTGDVVQPLVDFVTGTTEEGIPNLQFTVPGTTITFGFSNFISAVIQFFITAVVVFAVVKAFNKAQNLGGDLSKGLISKVTGKDGEEVEIEMLPPTCPFCLEEIKEGATRCPHCAGALPESAAPKPKEA